MNSGIRKYLPQTTVFFILLGFGILLGGGSFWLWLGCQIIALFLGYQTIRTLERERELEEDLQIVWSALHLDSPDIARIEKLTEKELDQELKDLGVDVEVEFPKIEKALENILSEISKEEMTPS